MCLTKFMRLEALEGGFSCFPGRDWEGGQQKRIVSSKVVPEDSNFKFRLKFNHSFTNCGSLHCTILKAFNTFKGKRAHKARDFSTQFFPENVENEMFKYNIKFTRAAC